VNDLPPFGDATDEAVSASIDGELDGFAAAHGVTLDEATRRLVDWNGFEARRRELGAARAAVATELLPLDAASRRHLVSRATRNGRVERHAAHSAQSWRRIAVVAATIAVVGAAGFGISRLGGGDTTSSSSKSAQLATGAPKVEPGAFVGEVGDVSEPAALRTLLTTRQAGLPVHVGDAAAAPSQQQATPSAPPSSGPSPAARSALDMQIGRDAATRCAGIVNTSSTPAPDSVVLLATARFQGHEAVVVGVRRGARWIAFVADRATCAVLTSQSL
jgi:hypothetical protein